ncbi:caspase family protein [Actinoplanes bogorensis]|uniref:Caspase family protein n=1 Tax=Paractinoplanes bogorensis TaxID=1610840 RepID=A0ABS5Z157_9ACTN|nr:caspase family protein [Actinoplanes bogorensis]MBU2669429.1 caspase family protein [Actinoplanes bogorensis]
MTYRALLIGNSVFDSDAGLNPLNAPTKDVARLHRALVQPGTGLFADEHVRLITERTSDEILDELDLFFAGARRDDLLLLYYSGHGLLDERNHFYLCGRTTRSDRLLRTAVSNVRINEFLQHSVARSTVIILDCCSSGMFKGGDLGTPLAGPGRFVVSSSRGRDLANDAATPTGTSLFTESLVAGMLGAAEDRNHDGYVDLREIFDYVRDTLTATSKQIPHCRFDGDAAVKLARRPVAAPVPMRPDRTGEPAFTLSENAVVLRDVHPSERLDPEVIEIYPLSGETLECRAETDATWLRPQIQGHRLIVHLEPVPGPNRGKILIRDLGSQSVRTLRVEVHVTPVTAKDGPSAHPVPPPEVHRPADPEQASHTQPASYSQPTEPASSPDRNPPVEPGPPGMQPEPPWSVRPTPWPGSFADVGPDVGDPNSAAGAEAENKAKIAFTLAISALPAAVLCPYVGGIVGIIALVFVKRAANSGVVLPDPVRKRLRTTRILSYVSIALNVAVAAFLIVPPLFSK